MLLAVDQLKESEHRYDVIAALPTRDAVSDFNEATFVQDIAPVITKGNILGTDENLAKRKEMLEEVGREPVDFAFERAIGKNDSVYSNFIGLIGDAKRRVGRIAIKKGIKPVGFATGFMVSEQLMLTNWHVFPSINDVADSEIQFFYELDTLGNPGTSTCFKLRSDIFYHASKELDYCFVAVNPMDTDNKVKLVDIGYIFLDPGLGKLGNEEEEALNIIHHPNGDYMQLSIRENLFVKITPVSIWYKTDTAPGSSGSPVFNDQWQVVALHHMGIGKKNASGDYIDKDGNVIPKINGKIKASQVVWEANEGMRISVILNDLFSSFPDTPLTNGLKRRPGSKTSIIEGQQMLGPEKSVNPLPPHSDMEALNSNSANVNISFPASLIEKNGTLTININQGSNNTPTRPAQKVTTLTAIEEVDSLETKKLEESLDLSGCKGYQSRFLGSRFDIPLPQPQNEIKKFIAKINGTDSAVLKYYNYSTIFHAVRMMPILSGINVNGDLAQRLDNTERKDIWLRDNRLSFDIQLDDSYYKKSGFDRGHMSRREDANWGSTADDAKRNADLTCMYTNACPQVAKLNQSSKKGLWGLLEKIVLESGAKVEKGEMARISVFNGPIFKDSDPVFKGIQVPMSFYKIILWLTKNGNLKATAFKLSQEELVDEIDFETIRPGSKP